jgi:hypothetical protein
MARYDLSCRAGSGVIDHEGRDPDPGERGQQYVEALRLRCGDDDRGDVGGAGTSVVGGGALEERQGRSQARLSAGCADPTGHSEQAADDPQEDGSRRFDDTAHHPPQTPEQDDPSGTEHVQRFVLQPLELETTLLGDTVPLGRIIDRGARARLRLAHVGAVACA